jgi:hypothetical protein
VKIERCKDCWVYYDVPFGHLCLWQRTKSGQLEVPDVLTKDGEPVYIDSSHFEEAQIDLMLDKFCAYRNLEDQLPRDFRDKVQELRTSRAIRACIDYWWKEIFRWRGTENQEYLLMMYPLVYVLLFEEEFSQSSRVQTLIEEAKEQVMGPGTYCGILYY